MDNLRIKQIKANCEPKQTMERRNFVWATIAAVPLSAYSRIRAALFSRTSQGFMVPAGKARFGIHYKMKGVTSNTLDIKISGRDTDSDLAVFEQTGLTPNGGPPLHVHPNQDEWFYIVEGEYT